MSYFVGIIGEMSFLMSFTKIVNIPCVPCIISDQIFPLAQYLTSSSAEPNFYPQFVMNSCGHLDNRKMTRRLSKCQILAFQMVDDTDPDQPREVILHRTLNEKGKPLFCKNGISTTKYSILTFLPKNLYEQFSRIANFYFLVTVALLYVPGLPISASAAAVPLAFVVSVSAIREAIEDIIRWRSDTKVNGQTAHKFTSGCFTNVRWDDILVGDIIKVERDEQIPGDIVIISTSEESSMAYIDTCNLDGETNLKIKQGTPCTQDVTAPEAVSAMNGIIRCDQPNNMLYTFTGCFDYQGRQFPIDNQNVILRGCTLRNTQWVIGVVVYTGRESKLMMNSNQARTKRSNLERGLNLKLVSVFVFELVLGITCASIGFHFEKNNLMSGKHWYAFYNSSNHPNFAGRWFVLLVSHLMVINTMIPISLYVTLEIVRVAQALVVGWDADMYDTENQVSANARTSNISDDLGQIQYVFSDKTGTLTRNVMEFMKCSIAGRVYGSGITEVAYAAAKRRGLQVTPPDPTGKAFKDETFMGYLQGNMPPEVEDFLWLLSICHAVIPEEDPSAPHGVRFQASSPDEAALVQAAADFGYVFRERSQTRVTVEVNGNPVVVEVLAVIEFSSQRKRSSVILRHPRTGKIVLFCKGADDLIFQRLAPDSLYQDETRVHLRQFAADGLRTLCCAYRVIDDHFFEGWADRFHQASCALQDREELQDQVANEVECNLHICGATAIEDKLQIGVSDTIEALLKAEINTWVITGDKRETAINIGFACSLLAGDMQLVTLDSDDPEELDSEVRRALYELSGRKLALVASGAALYHLLQPQLLENFFELAKRCKSVICCRVSPLQKAMVVRTVRERTGVLTLAIGDGANDVGMIQEADVGIGISGKEGRQAVLASDYSFGQFRFLKKLLLFHGRLNFYRNVELVNYSFYKNMAFTFNQMIYTAFTSFSGNTLYDSVMLSLVNIVFTSLPCMVYAVLDRDVAMDSMMQIPELYYFSGKRDWILSSVRFWMALGLGLLHSFISFFVPYFGMRPFVSHDGNGISLSQFGVTVYFSVVIIVTMRIASITSYWTPLHHFVIWGSIVALWPITIMLEKMNVSTELHGVGSLFNESLFYFSIIGTSVLGLAPVVAIDSISNSLMNITNRVLVWERRDKKTNTVREEVEEFLPPEPEIQADVFPDQQNVTGYAFDEPVSKAKFEYETLMTRHRFEEVLPPSEFNNPDLYKSLNILRRPQVSYFSLDKL